MSIDEFVSCVPVGRENGVDLAELSSMTKLSKRLVRRMIENVNKTGKHMIVNLSDGKGYYIASEKEKSLERLYRNQEQKRFMSLLDKLKAMNIYLDVGRKKKEADDGVKGQISLSDFLGG